MQKTFESSINPLSIVLFLFSFSFFGGREKKNLFFTQVEVLLFAIQRSTVGKEIIHHVCLGKLFPSLSHSPLSHPLTRHTHTRASSLASYLDRISIFSASSIVIQRLNCSSH
jgi:hypothetical protein